MQTANSQDAEWISVDPERHSGTPCFAGTRVPVQDLFDFLADGGSLDDFLESFPTVSRAQTRAALRQAKTSLFAQLAAS